MIDTTYGEVRTAYEALRGLTREGLQVPLRVALKWRRILGNLRVLVEQMEEQQIELINQYAEKDAEGKAVAGDQPGTVRLADVPGFNKAIKEMNTAAVQVGCERVTLADLGSEDSTVNSRVTELLEGLGPFFEDGGRED